jgi:hypothetical protein
MTKLETKVEDALNEGRILILGTQVLIGAQFQMVFQSSFDRLPPLSQSVVLATFAPLLLALGLLVLITPYHHITEHAEVTAPFHRFVTRVVGLALCPLAVALALQIGVATAKLTDLTGGILIGGAVGLLALLAWYGLELIVRQRIHRPSPADKESPPMSDPSAPAATAPPDLDKKIRHVLTEARLVLPGVQALLAFGFSIMMTETFDRLPASSRYLHLISLCLISLSVILLIAPAAYHRIVEDGENTERLHRFASRAVIAALVPLGLALPLDLLVVIRKVTGSLGGAAVGAGVLLLLYYGLWFGYTLYLRGRHPASG